MAGYEMRKKQLIKPDLRKLIKHMSDFQEDDSEFKQCENFALSNFLHHTYLSVNRHQVQRSIEGLVNKFSVHGFHKKAKRLERLVNKFVRSERFKNHEEVDVEWSILLLLISLSDNPTSMVLQEDINDLPDLPPLKEENKSVEPSLNWAEYLREGWEQFQLPDDEVDSTVWSELESDREDELEDSDSFTQHLEASLPSQPISVSGNQPPPLVFNFSEDKKLLSPDDHQKSTDKSIELDYDRLIKEITVSENLLKQSVQYDWWNDPSVRIEPNSRHPAARFAIIWEEYEHKQSQGLIPLGSASLLTEYKVIREVLWILQVPSEDTFLFTHTNDGRVVTKESIGIPSLAHASLLPYLNNNVCRYSTMVYHLLQFIDDVKNGESEMKKPPYTYQSYSDALHNLVLNFFSIVNKIEQKVGKQDTTCTLVSVIEELRPNLYKLKYVYSLHQSAVYDWRRCEGWFCTVRLLATLYEDLYVSWKDEFAGIALELFLKSFRVYLQIIDIWLSEGKLEDWRDEFIMKRYENDLKVVSFAAVLKEIKKTRITEIFQAVEKAGSDLEHIKRLDEISALSTKIENKGCLYSEFIKQLGGLLENFGSGNHTDLLIISNLAEKFEKYNSENIAVICDEFKSVSDHCSRFQHSVPPQPILGVPAADMDDNWFEMTTKRLLTSPWLAMSFKTCSEFQRPSTLRKKTDEYSIIADKSSKVSLGTLPLHHIIECCTISLFTERQRIASKIMVDTLLNKFKLQQHLSILGSIFVLEASYIIQRFYNRLFSPVNPSNIEKTEYSLNVLLEECVESILSHDLAESIKFSVNFTDNRNPDHNIIDCIFIDYKVDLPLSLIITKESLKIYNSVFKFLLKIEHALTSLHQLRFSDIKEDSSNQTSIRLLYKLRMFIMHCVTTLHSYFVAFTPRELRVELESSISQSSSVEDIINAHNVYLQKLKKHCLLDEGNVIMKVVKKLLVLSGELCTYWARESVSSVGSDQLSSLEDDYTKAHVGLHIVLKHTVGQHSNSSLRLLSADIERCLPVPAISFTGRGDQSFQKQ